MRTLCEAGAHEALHNVAESTWLMRRLTRMTADLRHASRTQKRPASAVSADASYGSAVSTSAAAAGYK